MKTLKEYEKGRTPCPHCGALLLPRPDANCRFCQKPLNTAPQPTPRTTPTAAPKQNKTPNPPASEPERTYWEWEAYGKPITQGSGTAIAPGVYKHNHAAELKEWRQNIEDAFRAKYGNTHQTITQEVEIALTFTLPRPERHPKTKKVYPTGGGDWDKLARAVDDAIAPKPGRIKTGPNRHAKQLRILNDDRLMKRAAEVALTYPRPQHTHPGALDRPGVRIIMRLSPPPEQLDLQAQWDPFNQN